MENKKPFQVYILWDKEFNQGKEFAEKIFDEFSRKDESFAGENIGLPINLLPIHLLISKR